MSKDLVPPVLMPLLMLAVPAWVERLKSRDWPYLLQRANACAEVVGAHGDALMFKEKNNSRDAFNALAEGLAIMSFCPGGVRFQGEHFVNTHD